jgi:flagellar biogenesis protein FliO
MSRRSLGFVAGLVTALLSATAPVFAADAAAPAAFIGPPPAPTAVPAAPAAVLPPPAAPVAALPRPAPSSGWLRSSSRPATKKLETREPMSPLRVGGMLILVAALGGGAYYVRRRRQGGSPLPTAAEKLRVLGSTRVGPKAFAVVAEVSGKRLLLGVTDQSVNTLAWLDAEPAELDDRELGSRPSRPAPTRREADESVQGPSGFLRVLRNAVGSGERAVAVDEIAKQTRDEVTISRRGKAEHNEDLEGQVRGLARRRRDPS